MSFVPKDPRWEEKVRESFERQTFLSTLGAQITALAPGRCELKVPFSRGLCQQHGFFHAGVTSTLADTASGYASFSLMPADSTVLTSEFKIHLLNPAKGQALIARAQVEKPGRTLTIVTCDVFAQDEEALNRIAIFSGTMVCLAGKSDR